MENRLEKSDLVLEEKMVTKSNLRGEKGNKEGDMNHVIRQEDNGGKQPSSTVNDQLVSKKREDQLRSTKAHIGEVREENERLKQLLSKIVKDYQSLQKHFSQVVEEEATKKSTKVLPIHDQQEPEFVSLSLGRSRSSEPKNEKKSEGNKEFNNIEGIYLGLDCKFEPDSHAKSNGNINNNNKKNIPSSESNSLDDEESKGEETWPPSKVSKNIISAEDEVLQQTQMKKTRVSVRTRCEAPTINDGCQWRKYGQKIAKGNPCPRAYYRCTVSPTCPVRKQVQRCAEDMSILVTTYEGTHDHPLPVSATAMASTTSAAASMLLSQSSSSSASATSISAPSSISTSTHAFNFSKQHQFYFSNSSISTNNSHPTITLDLTTPTTNRNFSISSSAPKYSPSCLNFSSSSFDLAALQSPWSHRNGQNHPYPINYTNSHSHPLYNNQTLTESIAAATKVIALDPSFRSALAAAITSFASNGGGTGVGGAQYHDSLRGQEKGSLVLFPSALPFSASRSSSGSPDKRS